MPQTRRLLCSAQSPGRAVCWNTSSPVPITLGTVLGQWDIVHHPGGHWSLTALQ